MTWCVNKCDRKEYSLFWVCREMAVYPAGVQLPWWFVTCVCISRSSLLAVGGEGGGDGEGFSLTYPCLNLNFLPKNVLLFCATTLDDWWEYKWVGLMCIKQNVCVQIDKNKHLFSHVFITVSCFFFYIQVKKNNIYNFIHTVKLTFI